MVRVPRDTGGENNIGAPKIQKILMEQKGMTFDNDFYVVVGKQCRTENAYAVHQNNIFI